MVKCMLNEDAMDGHGIHFDAHSTIVGGFYFSRYIGVITFSSFKSTWWSVRHTCILILLLQLGFSSIMLALTR